MPVVKGGVWTNIEDEILKSAVSKYGLNQWARVSSLLARKTPKQCKARWSEWLDPSIRKVEWSKEEDEKLLHLAKLMPTQWRNIAPIVGRTATQCLERYQKLLDDAEARENDELGLGGPEGDASAPSADDVRRLRPGEVDPDPESKPARPDTIDLDEDEKEMLSEARARLANTQGKKAKRKARERQLEESRRLAALQKRRELKNAGINIKITNVKKGQMDYNADIPFEKKAAPGFYDTQEEMEMNEKEREAFDPRKQQLANKRKQDDQYEDPDRKRRKNEKDKPTAAFAAAAKAGQAQKIREAEQRSKRRGLVLPAPQVGEGELEDIVKMGMIGEQAHKLAGQSENENTRALAGSYSTIVGGTPIRTPMAPPQEDHIANEIRNIKALTNTQSSLLGGENTPLHEGSGSIGFEGVAPRKTAMATPNPMATPFRQGATPGNISATPLRTPRDNFSLNQTGAAQSGKFRNLFAALPKPKESDWELELPEEQKESMDVEMTEEDAAERDRRNAAIQAAREEAELKRRSQVMQKSLPRPQIQDIDALHKIATSIDDPVDRSIAIEMASLLANDALKYPVGNVRPKGAVKPLEVIDDNVLADARAMLAQEASSAATAAAISQPRLERASKVLGLDVYNEKSDDEQVPALADAFDLVQQATIARAQKGNALEKKLALHFGGYQKRAKTLCQKIVEASDALQKATMELDTFRTLRLAEDASMPARLDMLREEVSKISKREREAQETYRTRKDELESLTR